MSGVKMFGAAGVSGGVLMAVFMVLYWVMQKIHVPETVSGALLGVSGGALPVTYKYISNRLAAPSAVDAIKPGDRDTLSQIFSVGVVLLIAVKLSAAIYGAFFGAYSMPVIVGVLSALNASDITGAFNKIMTASLVPLTFSLVAAVCPFIGAWIYAGIATSRQTLVGWGGALLYVLLDAVISLVMHDTLAQMGVDLSPGALLLGAAILLLLAMFFMGIGFNLAKLFKLGVRS